MPSYINFFDKAKHRLEQLRRKNAISPRAAALLFGLWSLEKAVGTRLSGDYIPTSSKDDGSPLIIAALIRGGIGDAVLSTAFLHGLAMYADTPVSIDVYSSSAPDIVRSLCHGHTVFRRISTLRKGVDDGYDIIVDITRMAWFPGVNKSKTSSLLKQNLFIPY